MGRQQPLLLRAFRRKDRLSARHQRHLLHNDPLTRTFMSLATPAVETESPISSPPPAANTDRETVERLTAGRTRIQAELGKVIVGQEDVIEQILIALFAGGHCLITGAPGLAKTLLVKSIAQIFHLKFQRIQFTPDLMPADITGTEILQDTGESRRMVFVPGPIFANMI